MNIKTSILCLGILAALPCVAQGATKNVTIEWTIPDTSDVQGYKMYYSYNSNMANKQLACYTDNPSATKLTCEHVNLDHSPVYFVIAALFSDKEASSGTASETFLTAISKVQGFHIEVPGANTPPYAVITTDTTSGPSPLTVHFNASQSSDSDGSIVSYTWNFGDGSSSSTSISPSHTYSSTGTFQATLTVADNQGATAAAHTTITTDSSPPPSAGAYKINFQPNDSPVPNGFISDNGLSFSSSRGYGWNTYMPNSRDRNNSSSPDQSYDTNIIYIASSQTWELALPNGQYTITVCAGDPTYPEGLQKIQIEGADILEGELSNNHKWIEKTTIATISDGRLTVGFQGSDETKICWIKIQPVE